MEFIVEIAVEYVGEDPIEEFTQEELDDEHLLHEGIREIVKAGDDVNISFRLLDPETHKEVKKGRCTLRF